MRFIVLALMMILLPLRGWMGDAMAMEMAVDQLHATQKIAFPAISVGASHSFSVQSSAAPSAVHDCHDAVATHPGNAGPLAPDHGHSSDCSSCSACQSCHSLGMVSMPHASLASAAPTATGAASHPLLKGVTPNPGLKPPIS